MSQGNSETVKLYLTGSQAGKTMTVGHKLAQAIDGVVEVNVEHVHLIHMLKKYHAMSTNPADAVVNSVDTDTQDNESETGSETDADIEELFGNES